ncbi:MAG: thioredoxin-dependent thiol peroxidase [Chloroflexi bacterium]|nr:thioredoxin-dependent thiol peroxidase [Chloroflexota bacterium]
MKLKENDLAPDFTVLDQDSNPISLSQFKGKKVVLYFYPKDDTPGCTAEACNIRDNYQIFEENGIIVLGVSKDSPKSHIKFREKYGLPFTLLADVNHEVADAYGVWGLKKFMGREYEGMKRTTFLIGEDQRIHRIYENVKPAQHGEEIIKDWLEA